MWIIECRNLSSLGGLGSLPSLGYLRINKCCKLKGVALPLTWDASGGEEGHLVAPRSSLQIDYLQIDLPSLLLVEPLNGLCQTNHLEISDGSEMESVPEGWLLQNRSSLKSLVIREAKSLESLPPSLRDLSSLEGLILSGAQQLRSLPDLPSSLKNLSILGCQSQLEKKFREYGSPEWNKISGLLRVEIGDSFFIMGKKCSELTFELACSEGDDTILFWANQSEDDGEGVEMTQFFSGRINQKMMARALSHHRTGGRT